MASVTVMKHTTAAACSGQIRHVYRENENYSNPDVQADLEHMNLYLANAEQSRAAIHDAIHELDEKVPPQRVKKDRKTVASLYIPAPREGMTPDAAKKFFEAVSEEMCSRYTVVGGAIHFDEIHSYFDSHDKKLHESRAHMHLLIIPETAEKGCNMKAWLNPERYREFNQICDRICEKEFGYTFVDGSRSKSRGNVEQMKVKSAIEAAKQLPELQSAVNDLKAEKAVLEANANKSRAEAEKAIAEARKRVKTAEETIQKYFPPKSMDDILEERTYKTGFTKTETVLVAKEPGAILAAVTEAAAVAQKNASLEKQLSAAEKSLNKLRMENQELAGENAWMEQKLQENRIPELLERVRSGEIPEHYVELRSLGMSVPGGRDSMTRIEAMKLLPELEKMHDLTRYGKILARARRDPDLRKKISDLVPELQQDKKRDRTR